MEVIVEEKAILEKKSPTKDKMMMIEEVDLTSSPNLTRINKVVLVQGKKKKEEEERK